MTIVFLKDDWVENKRNLNTAIYEYERCNGVEPFIYVNSNTLEKLSDQLDLLEKSNDIDATTGIVGVYDACNIELLDTINDNQIYLGSKLKLYGDKEKIVNK